MSYRNCRGTLRIGSIIWQIGSPKTISQQEGMMTEVILVTGYYCTLVGSF